MILIKQTLNQPVLSRNSLHLEHGWNRRCQNQKNRRKGNQISEFINLTLTFARTQITNLCPCFCVFCTLICKLTILYAVWWWPHTTYYCASYDLPTFNFNVIYLFHLDYVSDKQTLSIFYFVFWWQVIIKVFLIQDL